jgi:hypothetical protein
MVGIVNHELDVGGSGRDVTCGIPGICKEGLRKKLRKPQAVWSMSWLIDSNRTPLEYKHNRHPSS